MKHFTKCSFSNLALTQARCTLGVVFPKTLPVETDGFLTPPYSPYSLLHPGYDPSFLIASCPPDISNWMFYLNSPWPTLTHILTPKPAPRTVVPISVHDSPPTQLVPSLTLLSPSLTHLLPLSAASQWIPLGLLSRCLPSFPPLSTHPIITLLIQGPITFLQINPPTP